MYTQTNRLIIYSDKAHALSNSSYPLKRRMFHSSFRDRPVEGQLSVSHHQNSGFYSGRVHLSVKEDQSQMVCMEILYSNSFRHLQDSSPEDSGVDQCIMFTEEQLDIMIAEAKNEEKATSTHRSKR